MAGVYISYPFCTQKCTFCNFASGVGSAANKDVYANALLREIRSHHWPCEPETIYFGGGTPSLMPLELLGEIFEAIPASRLQEVTLECAPGTLSPEKLGAWIRLGVNRVSLGVQSFVSSELRQTGRRHDASTVQQDVALLHSFGIHNINIDLIAGLPGQTSQSWENSLEWIERIAPPHVSVYLFEIDEDSRLGKEILLGGVRYGAAIAPSDDAAAAFYEHAVERLASLGIARYEVSNFAIAGRESQHNLKYWRLAPYIGFGLDAASFDGTRRWSNPDSLDEYLKLAEQPATDSNLAQEHFFVGLRLSEGIEPSEREWDLFSAPIAKWTATGLLERQGDRLRLSNQGILLSNEILADFV